MTAAHRSLPLPTYVRITNLENNRQAVVRVNDRGPFYSTRIIDLSYAAAVKLRIIRKGTAFVEVRAIDSANPQRASQAIDSAPFDPDPSVTAHSRKAAQAKDRTITKEPIEDLANASGKTAEQKTIAKVPEQVIAEDSAKDLAHPPSREDLYLQVGAFTSQTSAQQLKTKLRTTVESDIRIDAAQNNGRTLYKVQLGPFHDRMRMDRVGEELTRLGFDKLQVRFESLRQQDPIAADLEGVGSTTSR